jgi:hypothetical protein
MKAASGHMDAFVYNISLRYTDLLAANSVRVKILYTFQLICIFKQL